MEKTSINKKARNGDGLTSWLRDFPPADYILKIDSFSLFLDTKSEMYESRIFEAGGYKWKLCFCPQGNKKENVNDHISLYLKLVETQGLPLGWEVMTKFKFFVFDHLCGKFLTIQDGEEFKRFNEFKSIWGFDRLLPLDTLKDAANGYLRDDCCLFGVEIYFLGRSRKGECISVVKNPEKGTYTWIIKNFSSKQTDPIYSDKFVVGDHKWNLQCYQGGHKSAKGTHMSLYLILCGSNSNASLGEDKVYADFKLRVKEQKHGKNHERTASWWFTSTTGRGYSKFLALKDLNDNSKGFIVNGDVIVEVEITRISALKNY